MSLNMKSLTQALAKTAAVIEKTVQNTVHEVTGPKALQEYELLDQVGSGGLGLVWKIYAARHRNRSAQMLNQDVCVWVLDKKALAEARQRAGLSKAVEDAFLDIVRADAIQLVKLRHPGVVQLVQGLDESKGAMAMVTEPIFASLANLLGRSDNVAQASKTTKGLELKQLEIKHGLWQLAESLSFLHNNARLIHCAVSPETVFITSSGAWKLAGFGFAVSLDQVTTDTSGGPTFHYPAYDADDVCLPLQPHLNYIAPELTRSNTSSLRTSIDTFSLACLAYHLLARRSLIDSKNNIKRYTSRVTHLMDGNFENIPPDLMPDLRRMLNPDELARPSALDFTSSPFFRDDTRLRALRFLDHMLERDNMQKSEFLKSLANMWTEFDPRVLRYKVLPPLCAELRNVVMQSMVLPMVLTIAESQEKVDFESSTFPALVPVLSSCTGDSLLLLVKHAAMLINKVTPEQLIANVVPMLIRAYDDPDGRMQEEVLRCTLSFVKFLDFQILKQAILPRLHALALKTTVSVVRVNALLCLGELVARLDKQTVLEILKTLQRCTAVDHSAPTLMCTLGVASSIYKQFGIELAAEHLLPLLSPILVAQQLNLQQFAKYMLFVKGILRKIEEKRGVTLNETDPPLNAHLGTAIGLSETIDDGMHSIVNGVGLGVSGKTGSNSWDIDDWGPTSKGHNVIATVFPIAGSDFASEIQTSMDATCENGGTLNASPVVHAIASAPISSSSYMGSLSSTFEWPPPMSLPISGPMVMSSGPSNQFSLQQRNWAAASSASSCETTGENEKANAYSRTVIDDFDPFLDWPPHSASAGSTGGSKLSASQGNLGSATIGTLSYSNLNSLNGSVSNTSNVGSASVYKTEPSSQSGLGELFSSVKPQSELTPLKLAPPPSGGLGKGRRRNPIRPAQSPKTNRGIPPNQLPPFDLI